MQTSTLGEKFITDIADLYDAERQFLLTQREMFAQATSPELKQMLEQHIKETEQQAQNIEQIFTLAGTDSVISRSTGAAGITQEGQDAVRKAQGNPALLDFTIATAAAKVEHYEIATYRGIVLVAEETGKTEIVQLLKQNLEQEEQTAQKIEQSLPKLLQSALDVQEMGA